jgi:8-oxo-dGTP pyrophosphatase MutT (NUDIX family)
MGKIRAVVLGLVRDGDRLLVSQSYDSVKQDTYFRALGGGIEFGETSRQALKREFQEEIQAELTNIQYLGCLENLFVCDGIPGHELVQLYQCDFADPRFYQMEQLTVYEGKSTGVARWLTLDRFKTGQHRLVPEGCLSYLE